MRQLIEPQNVASDRREESTRVWVADRRAWRWLSEQDRTLLQLVQSGASRRLIASAIGMSAGNVSRRVRGIRARLMSHAAQQLLEPTCPVPDEVREVAGDHLIGGKPIREIARDRQLPLYLITRHIDYARGMIRAMTRRTHAVA